MAVALVFKDAQMPKSCEECFLCSEHFFGFYRCRYAELWGTRKRRAGDCPLVDASELNRKVI